VIGVVIGEAGGFRREGKGRKRAVDTVMACPWPPVGFLSHAHRIMLRVGRVCPPIKAIYAASDGIDTAAESYEFVTGS